MQQIVF